MSKAPRVGYAPLNPLYELTSRFRINVGWVSVA
jgi:hypothetical protein